MMTFRNNVQLPTGFSTKLDSFPFAGALVRSLHTCGVPKDGTKTVGGNVFSLVHLQCHSAAGCPQGQHVMPEEVPD
eukprot:6395595-Amphidinium_carterae.1